MVPDDDAFLIAVFVVLTTCNLFEYCRKFAATKNEVKVFASGD